MQPKATFSDGEDNSVKALAPVVKSLDGIVRSRTLVSVLMSHSQGNDLIKSSLSHPVTSEQSMSGWLRERLEVT